MEYLNAIGNRVTSGVGYVGETIGMKSPSQQVPVTPEQVPVTPEQVPVTPQRKIIKRIIKRVQSPSQQLPVTPEQIQVKSPELLPQSPTSEPIINSKNLISNIKEIKWKITDVEVILKELVELNRFSFEYISQKLKTTLNRGAKDETLNREILELFAKFTLVCYLKISFLSFIMDTIEALILRVTQMNTNITAWDLPSNVDNELVIQVTFKNDTQITISKKIVDLKEFINTFKSNPTHTNNEIVFKTILDYLIKYYIPYTSIKTPYLGPKLTNITYDYTDKYKKSGGKYKARKSKKSIKRRKNKTKRN
jgi:hypothetical protein